MRDKAASGLLAALLLSAGSPHAAADERAVRATRVANPPKLDGRIDGDESWREASPITDFTQQRPDEGQPASENTTIYVVYDKQTLYIGGVCFSKNLDDIVMTEVRRDSVIENMDYVEVVLDSYLDRQNGFVFATNPGGMQYDGQLAQEGSSLGGSPGGRALSGAASRGNTSGFNVDWNGVWQVRSSRTERGWEFEMAIPFSTLRFKPGKDQAWGMNIVRNIRKNNEQAFWTAMPRAYDIFKVSLAGRLEGLDLERQDKKLEFKPFLTGGPNRDFTRAGSTDFAKDAGFDAKYKIGPQLTLDATYRTDFSQVESDDEQVNLDRFDLFFPEKRDFFLENDGFFRFGAPRENQLFFSRRIGLAPVTSTSFEDVPLFGGVRLSGKLGRFNVGLLDMQAEDVTERNLASNNFGVVRVSRDILRKSTVGFIFTNRQSGRQDDWNRVGGVDLNLALGNKLGMNGFVAKSDTPGLEGRDVTWRGAATWKSANWDWRSDVTRIPRNYRADIGFVQRLGVDKWNIHGVYQAVPKNKKGWLRQWYPHIGWTEWYREGWGDLITRNVHIDMTLRLRHGGQVAFLRNERFELVTTPFRPFRTSTIPAGRYPYHEWQAVYDHDPSKKVTFTTTATFGEYFNGDRRALSTSATFRLSSRSQAKLRYEYNHVDFPQGIRGLNNFTSHIVGLNLLHSFSTKLLAQGLIQYNANSGEVSSNLRLSFVNIQGPNLYIVFNERRDALGLTPHDTLGRAFIIKYAHLFRAR